MSKTPPILNLDEVALEPHGHGQAFEALVSLLPYAAIAQQVPADGFGQEYYLIVSLPVFLNAETTSRASEPDDHAQHGPSPEDRAAGAGSISGRGACL